MAKAFSDEENKELIDLISRIQAHWGSEEDRQQWYEELILRIPQPDLKELIYAFVDPQDIIWESLKYRNYKPIILGPRTDQP